MFKLALKLVHDSSNLEGRGEREGGRRDERREGGRREGERDEGGGTGNTVFSDTQPFTKKCIPSQGSWI